MNMTRVLVLLVVAVAVASAPVRAASPDDVILYPGRPGLILIPHIGAMLSLHGGTMPTSERGVACCEFDGGAGVGLLGGVRTFIPWLEDWQLSPRVVLMQRGGAFTAESGRLPIRGAGNQLEEAVLEQKLTLTRSTVSLDALVAYLLPDSRGYVLGGPALHLAAGTGVSGQERIIDPAGVSFLDGTRARALQSPALVDASAVSLHMVVGVGTWVHVPAGFEINPELLVDVPLSGATAGGSWKVYGVSLNIGVGFEL
jgi:hypothetical protein